MFCHVSWLFSDPLGKSYTLRWEYVRVSSEPRNKPLPLTLQTQEPRNLKEKGSLPRFGVLREGQPGPSNPP